MLEANALLFSLLFKVVYNKVAGDQFVDQC